MDGFGDNFDDPEVDPAAEFLAREQDQLAGLEDELKPISSLPIAPLNGSPLASADHTGSFEMINTLAETNGTGFDFSSNHTDIGADVVLSATSNDEEHVGHILPPEPIQEKPKSTSPTPLKSAQIREEPEKIKKWREEQKTRLEEKDANEEKKKEEMRVAATKELEEWYKHHNELIAKNKAANRNAEKQFVADASAIEPGTEWERIAKLCEFNPKSSRTSKDVSRMRSIILQLKQSPLTPKQS